MDLSKIVSFFKRTYIESQRVLDHLWLRITGLPRLRRSMLTKQLYVWSQYHIKALHILDRLGVTAIVNMRMTPILNPEAHLKFKILRLSTPDRTAPSLENLYKGAQFIDEEIKKGGGVYIHCHYGEGRGPSMAIAYLIYTGMTYDDAYEFVRKVRVFIRPTAVQVARLKEFEAMYINKSKEVVSKPS